MLSWYIALCLNYDNDLNFSPKFLICFTFCSIDVRSECTDWAHNGTCDFYDCFEQRFPCGSSGYALGYGGKYCRKFQQPQFRSLFNAAVSFFYWFDYTNHLYLLTSKMTVKFCSWLLHICVKRKMFPSMFFVSSYHRNNIEILELERKKSNQLFFLLRFGHKHF